MILIWSLPIYTFPSTLVIAYNMKTCNGCAMPQNSMPPGIISTLDRLQKWKCNA